MESKCLVKYASVGLLWWLQVQKPAHGWVPPQPCPCPMAGQLWHPRGCKPQAELCWCWGGIITVPMCAELGQAGSEPP